jgi:tRNA (pseudouridine54-N1)-methyltransferase
MPERIFVIIAHKASIIPDFTLNDLPGSGGRMDILARFVTSSFCLSHGIRKYVNVYLVLQNQLIVRFEGEFVKRLNPDERSTGALIKKAIGKWDQNFRIDDQAEYRSTPGVNIKKGSLADLLDEFRTAEINVAMLDEEGVDLRESKISEPIAFILSDHQEFSADELESLSNYQKLSLGPEVLHADQCVTLVHNELDRSK